MLMQCFCFDISFYCEHKRRDLSGFRRSSDDGFFERHFYEWFPWINIMIHFGGVWWNVRSLRQIFARRISARRFRSSAQIIETYCVEPGKTSKKGLWHNLPDLNLTRIYWILWSTLWRHRDRPFVFNWRDFHWLGELKEKTRLCMIP